MACKETEALFRDLFDQAGIGMAVGDLSGRLVRCNQAFCLKVGYTEEELRALEPLALAHPDDHARLREAFREFAGGSRDRHRFERRFVRNDGTIRWGRATVSLVNDADGKPECVLALLEDVTAQRDADGAMRHAEEVCRSITGSSPDFIMILDLDGHIRFINRTVPGMTVEDVIGTTVFDYVPERFWPTMRACYEQVARTGQEGSYEVEYTGTDGKVFSFASRVWPVLCDGEVSALTLCATDVSARRLLEKQLHHAQKMESIGRLAGGVAHDLNNQLSVIMGSVELAHRSLDRNGTVVTELRRIQAAGERAAALTQQLLAFGRKQVLNPRLLGLNTLVANVRDMVGRILGDDIRLCLKLGRVGQVRVDPLQIEQVILNLVINARDAMPHGGRLVISTEEVALEEGPGGLPRGRYALLRVADTGIGMNSETLARAFEPFFTTKEVGKGTGLGLAVAHGIVTQSGGHIDAESAPGEGATFRIHLPVVEGEAHAEAAPVPAAARGSETVLLVEDEPQVLDVMRRVLEEMGYHVLAATSGAEALARLAEPGTIHLLLTDVMMPGMDGHELARRALTERTLLRVIFLSGHEPDLGRSEPHVLLRKPVVPAVLAHRLREALDAPAPA
ncbi:MAG: PAS domain S-box protein [Planctomycetota bacterium]